MTTSIRPGFACPLLCLPFAVAQAQSTIDAVDRHAYAANAGWIDFRPSATDGVKVTGTCLSGYAYAANFGWIHFGDGTPANGHTYGNNSAGDSGVNLSDDGNLTGQAWAANAGWITFEQTHGKPRLNFLTGAFSGHAWSANLGWISLATPSSALATDTLAIPDSDGDGLADAWEYLHFNSLLTANGSSDQDADGQGDLAEYEANTDPDDPASRFRMISHQHSLGPLSISTLTFATRPGRVYRLEYDADLVGSWTNSVHGTFLPDPGPQTSKTFFHGNPGKLFFRAIARIPLQAP